MSRIGKNPIPIPEGVSVRVSDGAIFVKGPKGEATRELYGVHAEVKEKEISVVLRDTTKKGPALWGLSRALIANMIEGVTSGFEKKLEYEGIGYRANVEGDLLVLSLGFSHPVKFKVPAGIKISVEKSVIKIVGTDKWLVSDTAAQIRKLKPVEPYKGKGIRYQGEVVRRKAGKKAVAAG